MEGFFQPDVFRIRTLRSGLKSAQSVIYIIMYTVVVHEEPINRELNKVFIQAQVRYILSV